MMDRSSGCGPCPWSCSGKVGAYVIELANNIKGPYIYYLYVNAVHQKNKYYNIMCHINIVASLSSWLKA